ncbi:MAG: glycosyltransferase [Candidatus Melainabacteria bacterium]|jgi:cellulose synthase/poly-beta-1,6-N-acetylglucosamine synthase-like glycosyltransferase|nr:glycosyltransferase [Candidatus Melainabacteria bacterium]
MFLVAVLCLITLVALIVQTKAFNQLFAYVEKELKEEPSDYLPPISVILPCKGLDPGFKDNLKKLLEQDYVKDGKAQFEVIFTVASADDPAYKAIDEVRKSIDKIETRLVVAGVNSQRGQKINNQLAALQVISPRSEAIVFVDSDVIARDNMLRYLVAPLNQPGVGATTGYRFYIPFKGDWPSVLRSMWNRVTAWEMANEKFAFAWGGAMAIRKDIFEKARVAESWDRAADDDLSLTTSVKALGLKVRFVPQCLVASHGDGSLEEIVEWTNRQLILTKVYYPQLWMRAIQRAILLSFWLIAVLFSAGAFALTGNTEWLLSLAAGMTLIPVELLFLVKAQGLWKRVLLANLPATASEEEKELHSAFDKTLFRSIKAIPLAHLILPWMTLYSVLTNRIKWRGVLYELKSPTETVVV